MPGECSYTCSVPKATFRGISISLAKHEMLKQVASIFEFSYLTPPKCILKFKSRFLEEVNRGSPYKTSAADHHVVRTQVRAPAAMVLSGIPPWWQYRMQSALHTINTIACFQLVSQPKQTCPREGNTGRVTNWQGTNWVWKQENFVLAPHTLAIQRTKINAHELSLRISLSLSLCSPFIDRAEFGYRYVCNTKSPGKEDDPANYVCKRTSKTAPKPHSWYCETEAGSATAACTYRHWQRLLSLKTAMLGVRSPETSHCGSKCRSINGSQLAATRNPHSCFIAVTDNKHFLWFRKLWPLPSLSFSSSPFSLLPLPWWTLSQSQYGSFQLLGGPSSPSAGHHGSQ